MNDMKTWADIDASPLLQLPPEQRKKLHDANDERFRTFWAECFLTAQPARRRGWPPFPAEGLTERHGRSP